MSQLHQRAFCLHARYGESATLLHSATNWYLNMRGRSSFACLGARLNNVWKIGDIKKTRAVIRSHFLAMLVFIGFSATSTALFGQISSVSYNANPDFIANPERGFMRYTKTGFPTYQPLDAAKLRNYAKGGDTHPAPYQNLVAPPVTMIWRMFYLDGLQDVPIPQSYLQDMQTDFDTLRTAGMKAVIRFAYTDNVNAVPYKDATKSQIIDHIQQLEPVLRNNADVIATAQRGFIGVWGEGYYTNYFGAGGTPLTATNWFDRNKVTEALLEAIPDSRMVQLRYPQSKQKAVFGVSAPINSPAISAPEAFTASTVSRLGHHNDCFVASDNDFGTYTNYDTQNSAPSLKSFVADDANFVVVGGETCALQANVCPAWDPVCEINRSFCAANGGSADTELEALHYSYLNWDYNPEVLDKWRNSCLTEIQKKLGYRFTLIDGKYQDRARPGDPLSVEINLLNDGYAAPYNPRLVELVLRETTSGDRLYASLPIDPRRWLSGELHTIQAKPCLPANASDGNYELLLNLADPEPKLYSRPEYAIQTGNVGTWENASGYNNLGHIVSVSSLAPAAECAGNIVFSVVGGQLATKPVSVPVLPWLAQMLQIALFLLAGFVFRKSFASAK